MESLSYKAGHKWAALGPLGQLAAVLALGGAAIFWIVQTSETNAEVHAREAAKAAAIAAKKKADEAEEATARAQALQEKCVANIQLLISAATKDLKDGQPVDATSQLIPCEGTMTDAKAIKLLATARQASAVAAQNAREQMAAVEKKRKRSSGVSIGMTMQDVLDSKWGRPNSANKTTTARGTSEQWVYDGGYLYFDNGLLTAIQN